jgi:hypothetical protein
VKFTVNISGTYEVPDDKVLEAYGTTDPGACAFIDQQNDPAEVLSYCDDVVMSVGAVKE